MITYSIKLVDHTGAAARTLEGIRDHLQEFFTAAFDPVPDWAKVTVGTSAQADAVVIHIVNDIAGSYIQKQMPGAAITANDGGFTRNRHGVTGSEIYLHPLIGGKPATMKYRGYAKIAFHEALHNQWPGWSNSDMHPKGSLAASPPKEPLSAEVAELMRRGLSMKNTQLL